MGWDYDLPLYRIQFLLNVKRKAAACVANDVECGNTTLDFFSYIFFAAHLQQIKFHVSINPCKEFSSIGNRKKSEMAIFLLEKNSLI